MLPGHAFEEKTGARGLVNAMEKALIHFENRLPTKGVRHLPVTEAVIADPERELENVLAAEPQDLKNQLDLIRRQEKEFLLSYIPGKCRSQAEKHRFPLTPGRIDIISEFYLNNITDIDNAFSSIRAYFEEARHIEDYFLNRLELTITLTENAIEYIVRQYVQGAFTSFEQICETMASNFGDGFRLLTDKAGQDNITVTRQAVMFPESWLDSMIKKAFSIQDKNPDIQIID